MPTPKPTPQEILARAQQAERFLRAGQATRAVQVLAPAMQFADKLFPALVIYARALASLSQHERAVTFYRKAVKIHPSDAPVRTEFALALKRAGSYDLALQQVRRARETEPFLPRAMLIEAELLSDLSEPESALAILDTFEREAPETVRTPDVLADICGMRLQLSQKHTDPEPLLEEAQGLIGNEQIPPKRRALLASRMVRVLDKLGRFDEAMAMNERSKALRSIKWDANHHTKRMRACITTWTGPDAQNLPRADVDGSNLVFILGMPRSGSTLLEQMLAQHPGTHPLGERNEITFAAGTIHRPKPRELPIVSDVRAMTPELVQKLAAHTLERYSEAAGGASGLLLDKQPFNYAHVPLLTRLLPGCRVLHTMRDPRDVAVSYHTLWFNADHGQANSFSTLGQYFRDYAEMMHAWRTLPAPDGRPEMLDVSYEELVAEPERVMRGVLDFLGIEWDASVLDHASSERVAATASRDQVKSGLYASSIGRWKNYETHLTPFLEHMRPHLADASDETRPA